MKQLRDAWVTVRLTDLTLLLMCRGGGEEGRRARSELREGVGVDEGEDRSGEVKRGLWAGSCVVLSALSRLTPQSLSG